MKVFCLKANDSGPALFGNEEARMPDLLEISMQPVEEGKESKKKEVTLSLLVLLRKECMIMTQQAYAVAYF